MPIELTVATFNIAGAKRPNNMMGRLANEVNKYKPDFIGLQEVIRVPEAGRDDLESFKAELEKGGERYHSIFSPALSSFRNSHPTKWENSNFKNYYLAKQEIQQGIGMLIKCSKKDNRHSVSIIDPWSKETKVIEKPMDIGFLMSENTIYRGNRDTEPRCVILTKVNVGGQNILLALTHLSTLKKEDSNENLIRIRRPTTNAVKLRRKQALSIADYIKTYQDEMGEEPIVLFGDFNCEPNAKELSGLKKLGLVHAHLGSKNNWVNSSGWTQAPNEIHSHRVRYGFDRRILIDHIFASKMFEVKEARIIETDELDNKGENDMSIDHNYVVAKLELCI